MVEPSTAKAKPAAAAPPPPPPKPVEQQQKPAPAGEAQQGQAQPQGQGQQKAAPQAQTGFQAAGVKDGFQAQPEQAAAATQRAQGDTFEGTQDLPATFDKKAGGGLGDTLLDAAKTVAAPVVDAVKTVAEPIIQAAAPIVAPIVEAGKAIGSAIAPVIDNVTNLWDKKETIAKLADLGQPGVVMDALNPPDKNNPTEGMTQEQQKAYDALPPDQQQRYGELHEQAAETWKYRTVGPEAYIITPSSAVNNLRDMLTSGDFGDYLKVEDALKDPAMATQKQDVRELLFRGTLAGPDAKVDRDGGGTLDAMVSLAKGGTTPVGVDRTKLLGQLAHDINHPEQMKQGKDNYDCGGSTAAFVMALTQPAEYARMVQGLGENGKVELTPEWAKLFGAKSNQMQLNGKFDPADTSRSVTQQLFAKTFDAEAVNGQQPVDTAGEAAKAAAAEGVTGDQLKSGFNDKGVLGGGWDAVYMPPAAEPGKPDPATPEQRQQAQQVAKDMIEDASLEKPVMVNVDNHWQAVLGHDEDGNYWVKDPMSGTVSTVKLDDLTNGLNAVVYQTRKFDAPPDFMHNTAWGEPGGGGPRSGGFGSGGGSGQ